MNDETLIKRRCSSYMEIEYFKMDNTEILSAQNPFIYFFPTHLKDSH